MSVLGRDRHDSLGGGSGGGFGALLMALVSAVLLLSSLYAAEASVFQKARERALDAASPLLECFAAPIGLINNVVGRFDEYFFVIEQNRSLRAEVDALRHWEREARDLDDVLSAYEALGYLQPPPSGRPINALIVGESGKAFNHSMIVNAGRDDGVVRGQGVVDDAGLIGRIIEVSGAAARVLLLIDVESNVPVFVEGSEVDGILVGRSSAKPAIGFTRDGDIAKVEAGQRVVTSGAGGTLPRGLPVGVVGNVSGDEATVDLVANYARTRVVRIIDYEFPAVDLDAAAIAPPPTAAIPTVASAAGG